MVALNNNPAEELISKVKESVSKKYVIIGGIACVFLAAALIAAVAGVTYIATWFLAYLWNVGIVPFGVPTMTWWQVTAIWTLFALVATVIKKIFSS